jgi:hypothetical protein
MSFLSWGCGDRRGPSSQTTRRTPEIETRLTGRRPGGAEKLRQPAFMALIDNLIWVLVIAAIIIFPFESSFMA